MANIRQAIRKIGKFVGSKLGNPGPLPDSFVKEYKRRQAVEGETPLEAVDRVTAKKKRRIPTSDGYME